MRVFSRLMIALLAAPILISCESTDGSSANRSGSEPTPSATTSSSPTSADQLNIAFVYGDSINERYAFLIDARKELESEERVMEERVNRRIKKAEERFMELQQQAATMTQSEMQEAQLELERLDMEIRQFQEKLAGDYRKREIELQEEYLARIDSFLTEFNSDGRYDMIFNYQRGGSVLWVKSAHDVTDTILHLLNDRYAKALEKKKAERD